MPLDAAANVTRMGAYATTNAMSRVRTRTQHYMKGTAGAWLLGSTRYDYAGVVGDKAQNNSAVVAVVGWICRNFPEAPVKIARIPARDTDPVTYVPPRAAGPGAMLRLLERPNTYFSGVLQWMATLADWSCTGNAYWLKVRNDAGRVVELWWLPSWMVEPRWDESRSDQFIGWYDYSVDGVVYAYRVEDIVHFRDGIDPKNPRKGLSKLASLYREVFTDDEAGNMTASLMRNLGVPGVIVSPANTNGPTGRIQDPEDVKEKFMEKFGGDKRGEPMVLTIPTDVKVLSWSPTQMNMRDLRKIPEERISAVFGVAAIVAGLGAGLDRSTFSNFGEARKAAYEEAVVPGHRLFAAELEVQLLPEFGLTDDLDVFFDATKASAMREAAADIWKRYQDAATKGLLSRATFKKAIGEPVTPEDDIYIVPNNYLALKPGEKPPLQTAPQQPAAGEPADDEAPPEASRLNGRSKEALHL